MRNLFCLAFASAVLLCVAAPVTAAPIIVTGNFNASNTWPSIGNDTNGPTILITVNSDGSVTLSNGPGNGQGAYDGSDDTYIGVVNNSSAPVTAIQLTGNGSTDIFGFDGDGIGSSPFNAGTNSNDFSSGNYGGPGAWFSATLNQSPGSGTLPPADGPGFVHFNTPIPPGDGEYFSLEENLTSASLGTVNATTTVPEPSSLALMALAIGAAGIWSRRGQAA